ncbi:hypothetical protein [Apibacter sp. HY039]|uniref:hypothetical protein n=1 Tax=Apibacter sp. HY039 TaxID=2501476 RepID=UPI0013E2C605|nr:hypothetical protein [Apibacter sp. HY039]
MLGIRNSTPKFDSPHSAGSRSFLTHNFVERCEVFYGAMAVFSDCDSTGINIKL